MPTRKGVPNRNKQFLLNRLQDMYGDDFDPVMRMAENAFKLQNWADEINDNIQSARDGNDGDATASDITSMIANQGKALTTALDAWGKIAEYTTPKRKAIEISGELDVAVSHEDALDELDPEGEANQTDSEG